MKRVVAVGEGDGFWALRPSHTPMTFLCCDKIHLNKTGHFAIFKGPESVPFTVLHNRTTRQFPNIFITTKGNPYPLANVLLVGIFLTVNIYSNPWQAVVKCFCCVHSFNDSRFESHVKLFIYCTENQVTIKRLQRSLFFMDLHDWGKIIYNRQQSLNMSGKQTAIYEA